MRKFKANLPVNESIICINTNWNWSKFYKQNVRDLRCSSVNLDETSIHDVKFETVGS